MILFFTALAGISTALTAIVMLYSWWQSQKLPIYWTVKPDDDEGAYIIWIWLGPLKYDSYKVDKITLISKGNPVITEADDIIPETGVSSLQLDCTIPAQTVGFRPGPEYFSILVGNVVSTTDLRLDISTKSFPRRRTLLISLLKT